MDPRLAPPTPQSSTSPPQPPVSKGPLQDVVTSPAAPPATRSAIPISLPDNVPPPSVPVISSNPSTSPPQLSQPQPTAPTSQPSAEVMQQAARNDRKRSVIKGFKSLISVVMFFATVIIASMLINTFVFQSYYVDGTSMAPTLENDDRLIIDKVSKTTAAIQGKPYIPKRGDIVVLDSALLDQYGHEEQLIKRVVGLPGDTIRIANGMVTIQNAQSPTSFDVDKQLGLQLSPTFSESPIEVTVPENNVYVLGDNRGINGSFDSRSFGVVASDKVQGRLAMRIFPFNNTRVF